MGSYLLNSRLPVRVRPGALDMYRRRSDVLEDPHARVVSRVLGVAQRSTTRIMAHGSSIAR